MYKSKQSFFSVSNNIVLNVNVKHIILMMTLSYKFIVQTNQYPNNYFTISSIKANTSYKTDSVKISKTKNP